MNLKLMNRIFAAVVFIIALIVFLSTVQPSVSFWDAGEFTAAAFYLQVPHPPGRSGLSSIRQLFSKSSYC